MPHVGTRSIEKIQFLWLVSVCIRHQSKKAQTTAGSSLEPLEYTRIGAYTCLLRLTCFHSFSFIIIAQYQVLFGPGPVEPRRCFECSDALITCGDTRPREIQPIFSCWYGSYGFQSSKAANYAAYNIAHQARGGCQRVDPPPVKAKICNTSPVIRRPPHQLTNCEEYHLKPTTAPAAPHQLYEPMLTTRVVKMYQPTSDQNVPP